ncbi:MAG TPA: MFS transporter [Chitinophagales bacterium]|nr:MFS transporter [Chitinophagales bacterium]
MKKILRPYFNLEPHVRNILLADFFIQLVSSSFFLLLNYLMVDSGYDDPQIANFRSYQYLAVMLFAFPLGIFIRGRRVKPLFYLSGVLTPALSLLIVYAISHNSDRMLYWSFSLWGAAYTCLQIPALPYILVNSRKENHTEAITLFFLTSSVTTALCGLLNFALHRYFSEVFDVKLLMQCFAVFGFAALFFVYRIRTEEVSSEKIKLFNFSEHYDWGVILRAMLPTLIIAVGAGFTIPFINLFFLNVHGVGPDGFSLLGAFTFLLVAASLILVPEIKRRFGYRVAVTQAQALSVGALILLALTQYYSTLPFAVYLAGFFYVIRQPLMNIAAPVTSEVGMYYVGRRNRELMSAINSAIWSGSWFISSQFFRILRSAGMSYAGIFFITAALYSAGTLLYYLLIRDFEKRKKAETAD